MTAGSPLAEGLASHLPQVYALLAEVVNLPDVDLEYREALDRMLDTAQAAEQDGFPFTRLPFLTCWAVGGPLDLAVPVAAAWRSLHIAAQLLDDVEDGDVARMSASPTAAAHVINLSTGFIVAAGLTLARLPPPLQSILQNDFSRTILRMAGGQHADLNRRMMIDLDEYFQVMAAKSGSFFALATRAGTACATTDQSQIAKYDQFGHHVGILIQINDDLDDFRKPIGAGGLSRGEHTLPVLYALSVASPPERARLEQLLASVPTNKDAEPQARQLIVALGAEVYLRAEATHYRNEALSVLSQSVNIVGPMDEPLRDWVEALSAAIW